MKPDPTFREVAGPEMKKLAEDLSSKGIQPPNPILSVGWVAEDETGRVVGRVILHSVPVFDYYFVEPEYRGFVGIKLLHLALEFIKKHGKGETRVLTHAARPELEAYLKAKMGFKDSVKFVEWTPNA